MLEKQLVRNLFFGCFFVVAMMMNGSAQTPDLLRLEYTVMPENESGIRTNRYRALLNAPFKLSDKSNYLIIGSEYNRYEFEIIDPLPFPSRSFERLHVIDLNLGYTFKWNEDWRFVGVLTPRIASNLKGGIEKNDVLLNVSAAMIKEKKNIEKPTRLVLGLSFNSSTGLPFPLPLAYFNKKFHPNWSYSIGIPRWDITYHSPNKKHVLNSILFVDGYFVNIQNDIFLSSNQSAATISLSALVVAAGYQYKISKAMSFYGLVGHSLIQRHLLRDGNREAVFDLNNEGNFYLRTGFKIGIF